MEESNALGADVCITEVDNLATAELLIWSDGGTSHLIRLCMNCVQGTINARVILLIRASVQSRPMTRSLAGMCLGFSLSYFWTEIENRQ
jgi:hypothetical protein